MVDHQDLVARLNDGADSKVDGFAAADRDDHFVFRVVFHAEAAFEIRGNGFTELHKSGIGGIIGLAFFKGIDGGVADMPWRDKIRLTDRKGDNVVHFVEDIEKFSDSRRLESDCLFGKDFGIIDHQSMPSLSSFSGAWPKITPLSL